MKSSEQIEARIADLGISLAAARQQAKTTETGSDFAVALRRQTRLEGNIGALEWVLRAE